MSRLFFSANLECSTLIELLRQRAFHQPNALAYAFLANGEVESSLTYAELDRRARAIAATLQGLGATGDRVLLLYPQGLEYIAAFFGCLYAGRIAVPSNQPRLNRPDSRLQAIATDSQAAVALTTAEVFSEVERRLAHSPDLKTLHWMDTNSISSNAAEDWQEPTVDGNTLAFLQYTSGSTATPKGVMVCHSNLLSNLQMLKTAFEQTKDSTFVSWLPLFHDMGLIVMALHTIYVGARCFLMSPADFMQRPACWLEAISRYKGTISGGPNFAYELCIRKIAPEERETFDLSSWGLAVNGAEPVRHQTLERFAKTFAPCGFRRETLYPGYGLAEATVFVSGGVKAEPPITCIVNGAALEQNRVVAAAAGDEGARILVGCGRTWLDQKFALVDPESLTRCPPDRLGEIWVAGPNVARGYWNRPTETEQTFGAYLADTQKGPFLRTGDLGFMKDGELFIAGRIKDLIIIRGLNHYPHDIELTVECSHPALRPGCGVAFSVPVADEERLVVVQEVKRECRHTVDITEVSSAIRRAVAEDHELQVYAVVMIGPGSLPKTSSGKLQRRACRAMFLEGSLEVVGSSILDESPPVGDEKSLTREALLAADPQERQSLLESYLQGQIARILRVAPAQLGVQQPLVTLGLDSLMAVELQHAIETNLNVGIPAVDLLEELCITRLAVHILDQLAVAHDGGLPAAIQQVPRAGVSPLSFEQERLWLLDQFMLPGNPAYHITTAVRLGGRLDVAALEQSLDQIVQRHEILRTTFSAGSNGQPVQIITPTLALPLTITDLSALPETEQEARARRLITEQAQRRFDLAQAPLMRAALLRLDDEEHVAVFTMHHLISDAWSMNTLIRELAALYGAFSTGVATSLPELPIQYADFAHWQQQWMQGETLETLLSYWRKQLAGVSTEPLLPPDRPRPTAQSFRGAHTFFDLPPTLVASLRELGRLESITPFMTLLAAFKTTLYHYTGREDICVGSPTLGRVRPETEGLIGFFAYPLALRTDMSGDPTFRELLARVRQVALEAYAHQDVPFAKIIGAVQHKRNANYNPLFQVMFSLTKSPLADVEIPGLKSDLVDVESEATDFDLFLTLMENGKELHGILGYNSDLFDAVTIERLIDSYREALEQCVQRPETRLSQFKMHKGTARITTAQADERQQAIAVAATFTAEPLKDSLAYWMGELGVSSRIEFAPYNQVFQQLLDPSSLLSGNDHGVNVLLVRFEDWQGVEDMPLVEANSTASLEGKVERNVRDLVLALKSAAGRSTTPHLVCLCPAAPAALADPKRAAFFRQMEDRMAAELNAASGIYPVTTLELAARYPVGEHYDPYGDEVGHMPYTSAFFTALGTMVARKIDAIQRAPYKVIVLDCDQTLWKGVCGEEGALGVETDPARKALQEFMVAQHDAGMLLCLCSKNNEPDVVEVFERHPEMPLKREHIVSWRINWNPKSENIRSLAKELQLGTDSFIFLDDDPVECAEVQSNCPNVLTLRLPQEATLIPRFLEHVWAFDHVKATEADQKRTALYRQNVERERLKKESLTFDDFLANLELGVQISPMTPGQLERVAQLTQRTNQFNCTTIRRSESEIQQLCHTGKTECLVVDVRDRFGDYGLVGVVMFEPGTDAISVDTFLLSCRALGRGVEHQMLARLGEIALTQGLDYVTIPYLPTRKNQPTLDFLGRVGAGCQQPHSEGCLFRFPAKAAAALVYSTSATEQTLSNTDLQE
jgi:FkbH-like protein